MKPLLASLLFAPLLHAQQTAPCSTWYVDPLLGNNTNPGTLAQPLRTLTGNTGAMAVAGASAGIDTIVLLPGIYEANETWPLQMEAGVSIQGTSALNTVLQNSGPAQSVLHFEPTVEGAYDSVVVDGVSIVGRQRCVTIHDGQVGDVRVSSNPTLANCMLIDSFEAAIDIVVEVGNPAFGHDHDQNFLVENRPKIINCTIVDSRVGIRNRVEASTLPGDSEPGLLNVLLSNNSLADLEGIDSLAVITSAFTNAVGPYKPGRVQPTPVFNTTVLPPQYVEPALGLALTPFDLRVTPGSPAIDAGSMPALVWANGTTGLQFFGCTVDIFDADCEGYGNLRVERNAIDIGADESGVVIIAGYRRGTTDFDTLGNAPFNGTMRIWMNPFPAFTGTFNGLFAMNMWTIPSLSWIEWTPLSTQGVRSFLSTPPTVIPGLGNLLMALNPSDPTFVLTFPNPTQPANLPMGAGGPRLQFNFQALPYQGTVLRPFSNLQTCFSD